MKKLSNQNIFVLVVSILVVALIINIVGIILHVKNIHANTYTSYQSTFETDVDANNVTIYTTLKDSDKGFLEGYGPRQINLTYGRNIVPIKLSENNNSSKEYTLLINRIDNRSDENRLDNIMISNQKINFNSDQDSYTINVNNTDKININASLKSNSSYYVYGYEPRQITLSEGLNVAFIKVKSEAGSERQYKINIFKNDANANNVSNSGSALLESLSLNKASINFKEDKTDYDVEVNSDVDKIDVYAFAKDINAEVEIINPEHLEVGKNQIIIKVHSTKGEIKEYKINVNRKAKASEENKLKNLEISGYNIHFNPDKFEYEITANKNKNIIVSAFAYSDNSKITILENKQNSSLKILSVLVTSADETSQTYTIKVKREFWNMKNEVLAVIFTFIVGLGIVCIIKYFEMKNKKKKKKRKSSSRKKRQTLSKNK